MWHDPIVEEIHQIRLTNAEKHDFDLQAIVDEIKEHEKANKHRMITVPFKRRKPIQKTVQDVDEVVEKVV